MKTVESKKCRVIIELTMKSIGIVLKREIILKKKTKVNFLFFFSSVALTNANFSTTIYYKV